MRLRPYFAVLLLLLNAASVSPAHAAPAEGVNVGRSSRFARLVPAEEVEQAAAAQYAQLKGMATEKRALAAPEDPRVQRMRAIAKRMLPYTVKWNPAAAHWKWEVNLIGSPQINAFCMPGGKIAFFTGIIDTLQLTDDEMAVVMGHEIAHALREHVRERIGKEIATNASAGIASRALRLGPLGNAFLGASTGLIKLKFSRDDETEADAVGLELAARAGYDPRAGISLWRKMQAASQKAPPQWLSTHPASASRIKEMQRHLPQVMPIYLRTVGAPAAARP
ncbi:MAG TPA: M48 family metallopeptidase [Burkholderiales bacterium]|jgi:predicted Zn-dependent protease